MQYKSLIRLLVHAGVESDVDLLKNPQRLKKLLMAEFALSPTGFLTVDGVDFSKQEVLELVEQEDFERTLHYHQLIWKAKPLLHFLEKGESISGLLREIFLLRSDQGFVQFLSPYLAPAFNAEMKRRLAVPHFQAANDFLPLQELLSASDTETAFVSTRRFLEDSIKLFKNINAETLSTKYDEVKFWGGPFAHFLNQLPDELFGLKDDLSTVLINFLVEIQNADRKATLAISTEMTKLQFMDAENAALVQKNHRIYLQNAHVPISQGAPKKNKSPRFIWGILFFAVMIIRAISTCNDNSNPQTSESLMSNAIDLENIAWLEETANNLNLDSALIDKDSVQTHLAPVYFMIQNNASNPVSPFAVKNETKETIYLHFQDGTMTYFDLAPQNSVILDMKEGNSFDFVLSRDKLAKFSIYFSIPKVLLTHVPIPKKSIHRGGKALFYDIETQLDISVKDNPSERNWRLEYHYKK